MQARMLLQGLQSLRDHRIGRMHAQVHENGGYALTAVLRARVDLIIEEVVMRVVLLSHLYIVDIKRNCHAARPCRWVETWM